MKPGPVHGDTELVKQANLQRGGNANPLLSTAYCAVRVTEMTRSSVVDDVAVEEPLQVRLAGENVAVLMRTPGHDTELVAGYLYSEGIIRSREDIEDIHPCMSDSKLPNNVINILPTDRALLRPSDWGRLSEGYSSCGICGKVSIEQVLRDVPSLGKSIQISEATLFSLGEKIKSSQSAFQQTGGLHAAALFTAKGELEALREDVGRHNAVDKIIGYSLLEGNLPLTSSILAVTSRASFEIVQKAANAGVCILAVMSAPSSLAVQLAEECGMTLVAFLRQGRFNIYSREDRIRISA